MNGTKKSLTPSPLHDVDAVLELQDGTPYPGVSFGASGTSIAGECVFQTGNYLLAHPPNSLYK